VCDGLSDDNSFRELAADLAQLTVTVGLLDSVSSHWSEEAQDNWENEKQRLRDWAINTAHDLEGFAESFDEEEEEEDNQRDS
jgi:hypothetical protein